MSPWSESLERELFARRARALGNSGVPSLSDVLGAAEKSREVRRVRSARARSVVTVALAAACFAAGLTTLPHAHRLGAARLGAKGAEIVADVDAGAARSVAAAEEAPGDTCALDEQGVSSLSSEAPECLSSQAAFTPGATLASAKASPAAGSLAPVATYTRDPAPPACDSNESCAITLP